MSGAGASQRGEVAQARGYRSDRGSACVGLSQGKKHPESQFTLLCEDLQTHILKPSKCHVLFFSNTNCMHLHTRVHLKVVFLLIPFMVS